MANKHITRLKHIRLNFSEALGLLKKGFPLSRSSWAESTWVMIPNTPEGTPYAFAAGLNAAIARMNSGYAELDYFFVLKKDNSQFEIGWLPKASDLLACDWFVYNKDAMWKNLPSITTSTCS